MAVLPLIETERLRLRPFTADDADTVQRLAADAEVAAGTARIPHPYPEGAAAAWIATHAEDLAAGRAASWAITVAGGGDLVGSGGLTLEEAPARAYLGYWIGRPYWGRGYATEAAAAVVAHGFEALGLAKVTAHHFLENPASGRVLEKIGLRRGDTIEVELPIRGGRKAIVLYELAREEHATARRA